MFQISAGIFLLLVFFLGRRHPVSFIVATFIHILIFRSSLLPTLWSRLTFRQRGRGSKKSIRLFSGCRSGRVIMKSTPSNHRLASRLTPFILSGIYLLGRGMSMHSAHIIVKALLSWRVARAYVEFFIWSHNMHGHMSIVAAHIPLRMPPFHRWKLRLHLPLLLWGFFKTGRERLLSPGLLDWGLNSLAQY